MLVIRKHCAYQLSSSPPPPNNQSPCSCALLPRSETEQTLLWQAFIDIISSLLSHALAVVEIASPFNSPQRTSKIFTDNQTELRVKAKEQKRKKCSVCSELWVDQSDRHFLSFSHPPHHHHHQESKRPFVQQGELASAYTVQYSVLHLTTQTEKPVQYLEQHYSTISS